MGHDAEAVHARRWWTLSVLCLSLLIIFVGNTSLNVAIPSLSRDLDASSSELQWVIAAYSLAFAGLLFSAGALGDRFGRKGILQLGLAGFLVSAVFASASQDMTQLIVCRLCMGASAALIMPATLSILVNVFPRGERAKAIAIWAATAGAAGVIGPVASGFLLGHFWYGSVFLINVPILLVALVAGHFLVPSSRDPEQGRLDPIGALLSIVGISTLVFGLIQAPGNGWTSVEALTAFAVALVTLALFVAWELHTEVPMLDMRFFRNPAFSTGTAGMILVFLAMSGVMFLAMQYFQLILGYSPLSAAVRFVPLAPIMIGVSMFTPQLTGRFGSKHVVAAGMFSLAVGLLMFRGLAVETSYAYVLISLAVLIIGMALVMSPMTAAIMSAVPPRRAGAGSAMNDATRELGAALGVAVLGSVAASHFSHALEPFVAKLPQDTQATASSSLSGALRTAAQLPGPAGRVFAAGADEAFIGGIHLAVTVGAVLAVLAALAVLRYLPAHIRADAHPRNATEALENAAELGLGGVPPAFPDDAPAGDERRQLSPDVAR